MQTSHQALSLECKKILSIAVQNKRILTTYNHNIVNTLKMSSAMHNACVQGPVEAPDLSEHVIEISLNND